MYLCETIIRLLGSVEMNYILTCIELGLFIIAVLIAVFSYRTAIKSLRESTKTRYDMFLPILISSRECSSEFSGDYTMFYLRNVGQSIVLKPEVLIVDEKGRTVIEAHYFKAETFDVNEKINLEYIDHRITQGHYHWVFHLANGDLDGFKGSKMNLELKYKDIFGRQIKTTYKLALKEESSRKYRFYLNNCKIYLPK